MATLETQLKQTIKEYLTLKGYVWWYNLAGLGAHKGLPDLFVLNDGKLYGIECKAPKGKMSAYQESLHTLLRSQGAVMLTAYSLEDVQRHL